MKWLIFLTYGALLGAITVTAANAETVIVDDKAYTLVEIDGQMLVSNEWHPTTADGYIDDYEHSDKAKEIAEANESLKRIKG